MKLAEKMRELSRGNPHKAEQNTIKYLMRIIEMIAQSGGTSLTYTISEGQKELNWAYIQGYFTYEGFSFEYYVNEKIKISW